MNPVNATALYVSASRAVLQCDPRQPHSFTEMYRLLPFFRQSLACLVCGKLLQDPIAPTDSSCQHYVCLSCKGQKMTMKPACSWCKDYTCFAENKQLSVLVQCYRQLCLYITHSPLLQLISSQVGGSPEVMDLLEEVLTSSNDMEVEEQEQEPDTVLEEPSFSASASLTPVEAPPVPAEPSANPQSSSSNPACFNGPRDCNGLEELGPSSPEVEVCELVEEQPQCGLSVSAAGCGGLELSLDSRALSSTQPTVCSLRDGQSGSRDLEEGEVLLLSVEEVLQTLDPVQTSRDPLHTQPDRTLSHVHMPASDRAHTQMYIQLDTAHNYTQIQTDRTHLGANHGGAHTHASSTDPPPLPKPPPLRLNRKRSRSEGDREIVKPIPITSILQGTISHPHTPTPSHPALHSSTVSTHAYSSLSNGASLKPSRPSPNHSKGAKKHGDQAPKKPNAKVRSGASKSKDRSKDPRMLSGCLVPPTPAKPPYKKAVEKKGCKCGRATQNPSVLTCRGQRCPCYSNRKACLDCICRGCQNSYMANGEKKLEAFAVPEKALEQTRLTLGINLTSITAAAALRNPATTSIHGNTLLNVATATGTPVTTAFLSPSPPRESNYEDSLELLIG